MPQSKKFDYRKFDEMARHLRDAPETWTLEKCGFWGPLSATRAPNAHEAEWAYLQWSCHLNEDEDYELIRMQDKRIEELERILDQDPASLEMAYFNAIGQELTRMTRINR